VRREFTRQGLGYVLRVPELAIEIAVDRLSRTRGELHGELSVTCGLPGTRSADGHLHSARFSLSGGTTRSSLAKVLTKRANTDDVDWEDLLEDFCRRVMVAEREGDPIELVGALPVPVGESYRVDPLLPLDQVTILYGDGGTGKSTLAVGLAVSVQEGVALLDRWIPRRAPILYLDWEAGRASINRRVRGVAMGANIPRVVTIDYLNCRRRGALYSFAEDVARIVDQRGYGLVVVDSIGMAAGTAGEGTDANESAIRLFSAFGFIGTTILAIDHVNRADADTASRRSRPYGSIYKSNLARATFELRRTKTAGGSVLGLYHTKANDSELLAPQPISVAYGDQGEITYERLDNMPVALTSSLSLLDRITALLDREHLSSDNIADELDHEKRKVEALLYKYKSRFNRLPSGDWELLPEAVGHAV
jgi:hypothetical protein